ncbi:ABC transporter permease [Herbiconiux moechotypicola]|uniref:ABC transporter permease n=1 Tax=Herbiconiux moechotypicola TaxID=637393 RepID=A0ABP5QFZ5_9MICO|nr:ABC transporter permease [Herbiconiux moechotypicola]MCS5730050.1 ABC transporter permease [Herbiconiux moechotypicola]
MTATTEPTATTAPTTTPQATVTTKTTDARPRRRVIWWRLVPAAVLAVLALIGPFITPYPATRVSGTSGTAPGAEYWFGTDSTGLDVFSQTLAATQLNVFIAVSVVLLATLIGVVLGLAIGMNESRPGPGGLTARGTGRIVDFVQAVPSVIVGLVLVSFFGASIGTIVVAIAVILAPIQVRLVRAEVLRVRGEAYLDAARMAGTSELVLTLRHVLPNSVRPAVANMSVLFGVSVILTAALGFLGAGLPPPTAEWGAMIARGATDAAVGRWWPGAFPALALVLAVAAVSLAFSAFPRAGSRR